MNGTRGMVVTKRCMYIISGNSIGLGIWIESFKLASINLLLKLLFAALEKCIVLQTQIIPLSFVFYLFFVTLKGYGYICNTYIPCANIVKIWYLTRQA